MTGYEVCPVSVSVGHRPGGGQAGAFRRRSYRSLITRPAARRELEPRHVFRTRPDQARAGTEGLVGDMGEPEPSQARPKPEVSARA